MTEETSRGAAKRTLIQMLIGIVLSAVLLGALGVWLFQDNMGFVLGILLGTVTAGSIAIHLYKTIDKALDMDEEHAASYTRRMVLLRILFMVFPVVIAVLFPQVFHPAGVVFGVLTLKFGAYLQPLFGKLQKKI